MRGATIFTVPEPAPGETADRDQGSGIGDPYSCWLVPFATRERLSPCSTFLRRIRPPAIYLSQLPRAHSRNRFSLQ